ncbi:MAG: sulfatase [Planctomycetota bacterium]
MNRVSPFVALVICLSPWIDSAVRADVTAPNFLFVAVDDLNDFSGFAAEEPGNFLQTIYPDPSERQVVVARLTPTLNELAARSAPFVRAYCASALCGPSRTSLMTGIAPHASGYYLHNRHFRLYETLKDAVTLPQQLRNHGYFTAGAGKIFHKPLGDREGKLKDDWADVRYSWDTWVNHAQGASGSPGRFSPPNGGNMQFGPGTTKLQATGDWNTADFIARVLENGSATASATRGNVGLDRIELPADQPFFLACGLFRPHLPFHAPKAFFERFPTDEMTGLNRETLDDIVADLDDLPNGAQRFSDFKSGKLRSIMDHANQVGGVEAEVPAWRDTVQAYLACVAFADACLGRLLDGLENSNYRDNTVVVLWSDHGYHLGPKYHIAKQAVWEKANRVVLVIHDPRNPNESDGVPRRQLASLNDMYPTICELAGVPLSGKNIGRSLVPLLKSANAQPVRDELVFTYMEGNHCLRTDQYAYLRYKDGGAELYDMSTDPNQHHNLADDPAYVDSAMSFNTRLDGWLASAMVD